MCLSARLGRLSPATEARGWKNIREFNSWRKDTHWVGRKLKRDNDRRRRMAIRFLSWQSLGIALAVALVGAIGGSMFYEAKRDDWSAPDLNAMRKYRASQMSDEQLRTLHAEAVAQEANLKNYDREMRETAWRETSARNQRCSDTVYRVRNSEECSRGTALGLFNDTSFTPTSSQIFEDALLGVCRFVSSKQEARLNKCLPQAIR